MTCWLFDFPPQRIGAVVLESIIVVKLLSHRRFRSAESASARRTSAANGVAENGDRAKAASKVRAPQTPAALASPAQSPSPQTLSAGATKDLVRLFKLLSDATRLRILHFLLQQEELHVRALCELLGQSQPAVSHHLSLLRVAGLIESRRQGKHNFYRLLPNGFQGAMGLVSAAIPQWRWRLGFVELSTE